MWNRLCCSMALEQLTIQLSPDDGCRLVRFENEPRGGGWPMLCC